MTTAIHIQKLTRRFNDLVAVNTISFDIEKGEIFGLLGPNGAGKTTTLSMLATMLEPTEGTATVNGIDIMKDPDGVRKSIGIVFQDQSLDEELTAWENMDFHGRLYRIPADVRNQRIGELLKLVELYDRRNDIVKTFSGGMRRRLEIARGLLHHPAVLFLTNPRSALTPRPATTSGPISRRLQKTRGSPLSSPPITWTRRTGYVTGSPLSITEKLSPSTRRKTLRTASEGTWSQSGRLNRQALLMHSGSPG
jgi:ABC-2 type transport system ATP-binding protein